MEGERQEEHAETFKDGIDLCQQLMDRYAKSAATQHRHLIATAATMRSIITAESFPLTPPAYFAAAISALDTSSASGTLDSTTISSLLSFMSIALPLVRAGDIAPDKASEAVGVLVRLLERVGEKLAASSVRAAMKCLGILSGFCDLTEWDSVKLGFQTLLKFSVAKRPKVRRCAQECIEKVFRSLECPTVLNEASKMVLSVLQSYKPLAVILSTSSDVNGFKDDTLSKPEHLEVLHMLNVLKLIAPSLPAEVITQVLSEIYEFINSGFSTLTRPVFKIVEALFGSSGTKEIIPSTENILVSLASYVSLGDKNPPDTVISAMALLKRAMEILHTEKSLSWTKNLPLVCGSLVGLLNSEGSNAPQASTILKEVLRLFVECRSFCFYRDKMLSSESKEDLEATAIKSTCAIFEDALNAGDGHLNKHILAVISVLFLQLGEFSYVLMKNIVLKLADLMAHSSDFGTEHVCECIGSAVVAMGPERLLTIVPIFLDDNNFTYSNTWLIPILKDHVAGSSLGYYVEHIVPLAKSFKRASRKVKKSVISQDLLGQAYKLWGLLPSFCRHPTDTYKNFVSLADVLITFIKKEPAMHEDVSIALQVLVDENKATLKLKKGGQSHSSGEKDSMSEFRILPTYSKKIATKNIKALGCSSELLQTIADLFVNSHPDKRFSLKDAMGCLASVADSSITEKIFVSLLERFKFVDSGGEVGKLLRHNQQLLEGEDDPSNVERLCQRCLMLELASSLVEGANNHLICIIYNLIKDAFLEADESSHLEAYRTLSRILEEHSWFCSSHFMELIDLLLGLKPPVDILSLRSRFASFHKLMVHAIKMRMEENDTKTFLILNEIILTLKDGKEESRKVAYDMLLDISFSLRDETGDNAAASSHQLVSMILGYLSGSSPHVKSGVVSALSVLVYKDPNLCLSMPDLVPSLLSLLQSKALEVIKAVLGFVKVVVSSLPASDLQNLISGIVTEVLPWSSVSRNHFRSKVTVIFEILTRKCGCPAVKSVMPEKYKDFLETVLENRNNKGSTVEAASANSENMPEDSSAKGMEGKKLKNVDSCPVEKDGRQYRKRKRDTKLDASMPGLSGHRKSDRDNKGYRQMKKDRHSDNGKWTRGEKGDAKRKRNRDKGPTNASKKEIKQKHMSMNKKAAMSQLKVAFRSR